MMPGTAFDAKITVEPGESIQSMDYHSLGSSSLWQSSEPVTYFQGNKSIKGYAGNYWSDYRGKDLNGDDIGEEPYTFEGGRDDYPLMRTWQE